MSLLRRTRKYLVMTSQAMQRTMMYRTAFVMSILSGLIQALVLYYIWRVVFQDRDAMNGFSFAEIVTYVFISYAVRNLYTFNTETAMSSSIRNGSVAFELIKPFDYQFARFFESLGSVVVEGVLIGIAVVVVGVLGFGASGPASVQLALLFLASLSLSVLLNFALSYLVGLISFWTTSVYGFVNAKRFIVGFFSGAIVPLAFFPGWLESVTRALPFHAIVHTPVLIYLGKIPRDEIVSALLVQLVWAAVLWSGGRLIWTAAIRKVTIHGG